MLGTALFVSMVMLPTVARWRDREALIDGLRRQRGQLVSLAAHHEALATSATARAAVVDGLPVRLIQGRTPVLAASALQALLQDYASASRVSVTRLDVVTASDSTSAGDPTIPASIAAVGDIYGLADFLSRVERGNRLLEVSELSVSSNAALRGELLQISLLIRAPYVRTP